MYESESVYSLYILCVQCMLNIKDYLKTWLQQVKTVLCLEVLPAFLTVSSFMAPKRKRQ